MDNNKVRLNITIDQSTKEYIDKVKKEKNLRSQSQAIDYIIMQESWIVTLDVLKYIAVLLKNRGEVVE